MLCLEFADTGRLNRHAISFKEVYKYLIRICECNGAKSGRFLCIL